MSVETHVDRARSRVGAELEAVEAKRDAIDDFVDRVEGVPTEPVPARTGTFAAGSVRTESAGEDRRGTVRAAFAETVHPHSVADADDPGSPVESLRREFSGELAVALSPTTDGAFTPELKRAVLSEATARRAETTALRRALDRERSRLESACEVVDEVVGWLAGADETPLTDLGFGALQRRHETLAGHRDRCETLARRRQSFLRGTTSEGVEAGIRHRRLLDYLYRDFPVDHPVLSTVVRLDEACAECQRAVRRHLTRRA